MTRGRDVWRPTLWAAAAVVVVTVAIAVLPFVSYAYRSPGLHVVLGTADAFVALLVAFLVHGRYRDSHRVRELLLACSMVVLAVANLPLAALPAALGNEHLDEWAPLLMRSFGALLFAAAALVPGRVRTSRAGGRRAVVVVALAVVWLAAVGVVAGAELPPAVPADLVLDAARPSLEAHPFVLAAQVASALLYVVAAGAFTRSAAAERDELLRWCGAAAVLAAGARVNYFLFPSLYTDYLYTGDLLRLGFYALLVVGAAREIESYWSARFGAAVARGRHDLARELQEVGLPPLRAAVEAGDADRMRRVAEQLEAAAEEVRREAAEAFAEEPLEASLRAALWPVAAKFGTRVECRVEPGLRADAAAEALVAIVREAIRIAARDAGARSAVVEVSGEPLRLVVVDDRRRVAAPTAEQAAGLELMQRWAAEQGGVLTVTSTRTATTTTVDWL